MTEQKDEFPKAPTTATQTRKLSITQQNQRRRVWLERTQILANVIVPAAFLITALAFVDQTKQSRRDTTARQIDTFYSEGLSLAQTRLFSVWADKDLSALRDTGLSRKAIDALVEKTIQTSNVERNEISAAIVSLTQFFDRAESCIQVGKCDQQDMMDEIGGYGKDFYCTYVRQVAYISERMLLNDLGDGLRAFAKRSGTC